MWSTLKANIPMNNLLTRVKAIPASEIKAVLKKDYVDTSTCMGPADYRQVYIAYLLFGNRIGTNVLGRMMTRWSLETVTSYPSWAFSLQPWKVVNLFKA